MTTRSPAVASLRAALTLCTIGAGVVVTAAPAFAGGPPNPQPPAGGVVASPLPAGVDSSPAGEDVLPLGEASGSSGDDQTLPEEPTDVEVDRALTDAIELSGDWDAGWTGPGRDFTWYQRRGYLWEVGYGWGYWSGPKWVPCPRPVPPPPPCDCEETPAPSESPEPTPSSEPTTPAPSTPAPSTPAPTPSETTPVSTPSTPAAPGIVTVDNPAPPAPETAPAVPSASEELPVTGTSGTALIAAGAITLAAGSALAFSARRRRVPA